ncbi:Putative AC transposase [Linum grandiflorum]
MMKAKCNYCRKLLGGETVNGTSHLRTHRDSCIHKRIHDGTQKIMGPNYLAKGKKEITATQFSNEVSRKELAIMMLMHEYPLSMVDHLYFKRFVCTLQPLFKVPSRNTMKKDILSIFVLERTKMQKVIDGNKGRVAITTDMWTATTQKKGYMAVTTHYIDNSWKLRNHMIRFLYVPAPHTSERLAKFLIDSLMDWNVDSKMSTITLDNCSTNDAMIEKIRRKLDSNTLLMDGAFFHMRCSAHVLNLIVKDGLDVIKDGIEKVRESVVYWSATPKRLETFQDAAKQLRVSCEKRLVLDCPTRWNSTYLMLASAIPYKDVFNRLKARDSQYDYVPTNSQWDFAVLVCEKLAIFNDISVLFSGNNYPTVNLFFPRICELKLKLLEWRLDSVPVIRDMAESMWLKFTKYWSTIHIVLAISVILDPRYKFDLVEYYALKFGVDASFDKEVIKTILYDLVREYQMKPNSSSSSAASSSNGMKRSANDHDFEMYVSQRKRSRISTYKTELDHYLTENIIPFEDEFDLLVWWQQNGPKYPMLQGIARDLLAIPITSVASEAAFSAGGRLLDPHRSRLNSVTVEAMMCTHSWIQDSHNSGMILVKVNVFVYYLICVDSTNQVLLFCCSKQSREMKKMEL